MATVQTVRGVRRLVSVCAQAEAAGLHPGQTLIQARALCPAVLVAESEPAEDASALAALAQWCTRATPLAAAAPPDTLWLDIAGCDHLYGSEAALAEDLAEHMQRWALMARWAVAGTTGAAYALARHRHTAIVATGQETTALAALPIEALRLDADAAAGLRRLGLKTIDALAQLPRAELAARFGATTLLRVDQASGRTVEVIAWPQPPADWTEAERFAEPISTLQACSAVLEVLAGRLCDRLAAQCLGGRQFVAGFVKVDGTIAERAIATSVPVRDPVYLLRLLVERLEGLDPGFGIETVSLCCPAIEASAMQQENFLRVARPASQKLVELIDTLANRLRPHRLWRYAPRDSHIPEHAVQPAPPLSQVHGWIDDPSAPRPIRLLRHPERIDVTAPLPDDPPLQFRWRGALHRVRAANGPERIEPEWWAGQEGGARDYYQVEDQEGARFWVFHDATAWWLHGLFG